MQIQSEGFIKSQELPFRLSGPQKAAILLAELHEAAPEVYRCLNLDKKSKKKLLDAYKALGQYDRFSSLHAAREVDVLTQALNYGWRMGIYEPQETVEEKSRALKNRIQGKESDAAKLLRLLMERNS